MEMSAYQRLLLAISDIKIDNSQIQNMMIDFEPEYPEQMSEILLNIKIHRPQYFAN